MQKIEVMVGIPASSKTTYCRELMKKEPGVWKHLSNDDLRLAFDFGIWTKENEQIIRSTRQHLLKEFLVKGFSVLVDNLNIGKRNWEEITKIAKESNRDVMVYEKPFYIDLEEAVARDGKRTGTACVGRQVIEKWWNESGKEQHKFYRARTETYYKRSVALDAPWQPMEQDRTKPKAIIVDLDGSYALIGNRSPYDASRCHEVDFPHMHVIDAVHLYHQSGYQVIFCSGREDKDRASTEAFIDKHSPGMEHRLLMRKTGDMRSDDIIKEEIFNAEIKDKYWIGAIFDDRLKVCKLWYRLGLPLFRVNNPEASF